MQEFVLRLRERDGVFNATLRQVAPHSILDAPPRAGTTDAHGESATAAGALVAAIANARIPQIGLSKARGAANPAETTIAALAGPQTERVALTERPAWPLVRELLVYWPAWQSVVEYVSRSRPDQAEPQSIYGAAVAVDFDRLAALLFAHHHGETLAESAAILTELLDAARDGFRPRTGLELGLAREMFEERS